MSDMINTFTGPRRSARRYSGQRGPGVLLLLLVVALVVSACSGEASTATTSTSGDDSPTTSVSGTDSTATSSAPNETQQELRFLVGEPFWADWNPYGHTAVIAYSINGNIFDRLVELGPDLSIQPGLATEWRNVDETTWEFDLREDVTFHNGQPFTAADVKASIELASGFSGVETVSASSWVHHEVEVVDDYTVRLIGETPFGPLLNTLSITDIVSVEDAEQGVDHLAASPNGTGPFRLVEDEANVKTLAAFEDYYQGPPQLDTLIWEYIQDPQTRANAILAGQAQVIDGVEPDQIPLLDEDPNVDVLSTPSTRTEFLEFRSNKPPFDNPLLREAVAWAIDREALAELVGGGTTAAFSFYAPAVEFYAAQEPSYAKDMARARELFDQAGVAAPVPIEFVCHTGVYPKSADMCEIITADLEELGFQVELTILELAAWLDILLGEEERAEVLYGGWSTIYPDPSFALTVLYHPDISATGWDDETTRDLLDRGRAAVDQGERLEIYEDLQAHLWSELPHLPLVYGDFSVAEADGVDGLVLYPNRIFRFYSVSME